MARDAEALVRPVRNDLVDLRQRMEFEIAVAAAGQAIGPRRQPVGYFPAYRVIIPQIHQHIDLARGLLDRLLQSRQRLTAIGNELDVGRLELVPGNGSREWQDLQTRAQQGGVHCAGREL